MSHTLSVMSHNIYNPMDDPDTILMMYPAFGAGHGTAQSSIELGQSRADYVMGPQTEELNRVDSDADIVFKHIKKQMMRMGPVELHDNRRFRIARNGFHLKFSSGTHSPIGFIIGTADVCDSTWDNSNNIQSYYIAFQFDDMGRLYLQDLNDTGPASNVEYDGWAVKEGHPGHRWIIGGTRFTSHITNIYLRGPHNMNFLLRIPRHDPNSPEFQERVASFKRCKTGPCADDLAAVLKGRLGTAPERLFRDLSMVYRRPMTNGQSCTVSYSWDATSGAEVAIKSLIRVSDTNPHRETRLAWARAAKNLFRKEHPHILTPIELVEAPYPELHFEFMPLGSLADQMVLCAPLSQREVLQVLYQTANALGSLHGNNIYHGAVSPKKILVSQRDALRGIFVKIAGFGLPKANGLPWIRGSVIYTAPEMYTWQKEPSAEADIWSLGVVIMGALHGLPSGLMTAPWPNTVRRHVRSRQAAAGSLKIPFLLNQMLPVDPTHRATAFECYWFVTQLPEYTTLGVEYVGAEQIALRVPAPPRPRRDEGSQTTEPRSHSSGPIFQASDAMRLGRFINVD